MKYIPVTQLRRCRKKNSVIITKKLVVACMLITSVVSLLLLIAVLPQSMIAHASTLLALCTLLLFGGVIAGLFVSLLLKFSRWLRNRKSARAVIQLARREMASERQARTMVLDKPHLQHSFFRVLESLLSISAWAFFINLMQPFITAILWWQGYKLMFDKAFSLATIEGTLIMIENSVYFGIAVYLILLSWSEWNYYRYGRLNRRKAKPLVSNTDLAVFYGVSLATVQEAQSVKCANVVVGPGFVTFERISPHEIKKVLVYTLFSLLLCFPNLSWAATFSASMSAFGYDRDVIVTGAKTNLSIAFPVPRMTPLAGSTVNVVVEPGKNLNDSSNFTFYLNDRKIATVTAAQLRAKPNVQLTLPPYVANKGQVQVGIVANVFATNDICADDQRGHLFYTVHNSSALTMLFAPPVPKTIPEFFNTLTNGVVIIIPDNPTLNEIGSGASAYGILQKQYPYVPVTMIFASERGQYPNLPRIWIGLLNHLPGALGTFTQGLHLPFPDTVVMAGENENNLQDLVKQLAQLPIMEVVPSSTIHVSQQNEPMTVLQDKIYFGNNTAQEGISTVPVDFEIYPALLPSMPRSLSIHLEGRYGPSTIVGKQVRLDVFFNRKLIHSELLDASGVLNKDITVPNSLTLQARNALSLVFEYPDDKGYCKVQGMSQSVQVLQSSYISGIDKFGADQFTWPNIGLLFNKKGYILISDNLSIDSIRSVGEMVLLMNKQLPPGVFAYPDVSSIGQFSSGMKSDYLILLALAQDIPEELQQALPLQRSKDYTLYRGDGGAVTYRYQSVGNTILGQIGEYHGIPLISISANMLLQSLPRAIRNLQTRSNYNELSGNIFIVNEQSQLSSLSNRPFDGSAETSHFSWLTPIIGIWEKIEGFAEFYQKPIIWALGILVVIAVGKMLFISRRK